MKPMNYTEARANLASVLDTATDDLDEVVITRAGHAPAVVVALSEYEALKETAYLLSGPANARHLERSISEHRSGRAIPRELVDTDDDQATASGAFEARRDSSRYVTASPVDSTLADALQRAVTAMEEVAGLAQKISSQAPVRGEADK